VWACCLTWKPTIVISSMQNRSRLDAAPSPHTAARSLRAKLSGGGAADATAAAVVVLLVPASGVASPASPVSPEWRLSVCA